MEQNEETNGVGLGWLPRVIAQAEENPLAVILIAVIIAAGFFFYLYARGNQEHDKFLEQQVSTCAQENQMLQRSKEVSDSLNLDYARKQLDKKGYVDTTKK